MVRHLPAPTDGQGRVETGAVKFGDDWAGLFIRGDNAIDLRQKIHDLLEYLPADVVRNNYKIGNVTYILRELADIIGKDVMFG